MLRNISQTMQQKSGIDVTLTLWRPLLPYGFSYKASCARPD